MLNSLSEKWRVECMLVSVEDVWVAYANCGFVVRHTQYAMRS